MGEGGRGGHEGWEMIQVPRRRVGKASQMTGKHWQAGGRGSDFDTFRQSFLKVKELKLWQRDEAPAANRDPVSRQITLAITLHFESLRRAGKITIWTAHAP